MTEKMLSDTADSPQRVRQRKIVVVGRVPPPTGGVASSVLSLLKAMEGLPGVQVIRLDWYHLWRAAFIRPLVVHFHFSDPKKRLLGTLIARMFGLQAVHTIHGNTFRFDDWKNKIVVALAKGFILINDRIYDDFVKSSPKSVLSLMTPIFQGSIKAAEQHLDTEMEAILASLKGRKIALAYAYRKDYRDGVETYGFKFLGNVLPQLDALGYSVLFLDPKGEYADEVLDPHGVGNAIHIPRSVNFRALCQRIDLYLRPTATDGNSVAVLEALDEGAPVVASDVVPRPKGITLYKFDDEAGFIGAVKSVSDSGAAENNQQRGGLELSTAADYLDFIDRVADRQTSTAP